MSDRAMEILGEIYRSYDSGETAYSIKMPRSSKIHALNMALKELEQAGYISIVEKNLTRAVLELTDEGLEYCMERL